MAKQFSFKGKNLTNLQNKSPLKLLSHVVTLKPCKWLASNFPCNIALDQTSRPGE